MLKKYNGWILFISLILILIIIISLIMFNFNKNEFKIHMEVIKEVKDNYNIEINYPVFNNKSLNKKVSQIIDVEKSNFKEKIKKDNNKSELNIDYGYTVKDNIYSVHIRTYSYIGLDNEFYHNDEIIYINALDNKEVKKDDLVNDEIYEVIKDDCKNYLVNHKNLELYEDSVIDEALNNCKMIFDRDGFTKFIDNRLMEVM